MKRIIAALTLAGLMSGLASAHCDTMNGPVVKAAREALAKSDPKGVLVWVQPGDEAQIKEAFGKTLEVRKLGGKAAELADLWFFETLVRVHRAGEGEPYTGLKSDEPEKMILELDAAVDKGDIRELAAKVGGHAEKGIKEKFEALREALKDAPQSLEKGRAYVGEYVAFMHYVEGVAKAVHGGAHHGEKKTEKEGHAD